MKHLPKEHINDAEIIAKARHMCRVSTSDQWISDYLGMALPQVRQIRRTVNQGMGSTGRPRGNIVKSQGEGFGQQRHNGFTAAENARLGSERLLDAILRYYRRHHTSCKTKPGVFNSRREAA
jgi:hypothetical protein